MNLGGGEVIEEGTFSIFFFYMMSLFVSFNTALLFLLLLFICTPAPITLISLSR